MIPNPIIHSTTFGGNPLACAAGLAAIQVTLEEDLPGPGGRQGRVPARASWPRCSRSTRRCSTDAHGKGLLIGMEFPTEEIGWQVAAGLFKRGVLVAGTYSKAQVIRIEPALGIPMELLQEMLNRLEDTLLRGREDSLKRRPVTPVTTGRGTRHEIPSMVRTAPARSAADFLPPDPTISRLRAAAESCRGCELWRDATQTVFGEGPVRARVIFVGEEPGDEEDRVGRPFVGPAGRLFDEALAAAGLDRDRRLSHQRGQALQVRSEGADQAKAAQEAHGELDVRACQPWLREEIRLIQPRSGRRPGQHGGPVAAWE